MMNEANSNLKVRKHYDVVFPIVNTIILLVGANFIAKKLGEDTLV